MLRDLILSVAYDKHLCMTVWNNVSFYFTGATAELQALFVAQQQLVFDEYLEHLRNLSC